MSSTTAEFAALIGLLQDQLAIYQEILTLSEQKKEHILQVDIAKLEEIVRMETSLLTKVGKLEKQRLAETEKLHQAYGIVDPNASLSDLITKAPEPAKTTLTGIKDDFASLIEQLTALNNTNRELLDVNIDYNDMMLGMMVQLEDPLNSIYGDDGNTTEDTVLNPGFFDQQA